MQEQVNIILAGHVDHGKSTLAACLAQALGRFPEGREDEIRRQCERRGMPFEWSFLLDSLQVERDQGITVEVSHLALTHAGRRYALIDAPGHREFLHAMITGAAQADAALLVVDAVEGLRGQTRSHAMFLQMLGIQQLSVAVNKMDALDYREDAFLRIAAEVEDFLRELGISPMHIVPVSARNGEGLVAASVLMKWYAGPVLMDALAAFASPVNGDSQPLRFFVQDIYKFDHRRILAGRVESGRLQAGEEVVFSPGGQSARIATFETWTEGEKQAAGAGESIGITLDTPLFVERGAVASHATSLPMLTDRIHARIFWLDHAPLEAGMRLRLRLGTQNVAVEVIAVSGIVDTANFRTQESGGVPRYGLAQAVIRTRSQVAVDGYENLPRSGRFVLEREGKIVGGGRVDGSATHDQRLQQMPAVSKHLAPMRQTVGLQDRIKKNGHLPGVFWLFGLSGAGKSTLAQAVQRRLFERGFQVCVLDGDGLRAAMNRDLGFSTADRAENLRRAAETAALMAANGTVVLAAFITPLEEDRARVRALIPDCFYGVYVKAGMEACEKRDERGLYARARRGEIADFTGVSAHFDEPREPDIVLDTETQEALASVARLTNFIERQCEFQAKELLTYDYYGDGI